jgi:SAM-dependent methyltransferase
VIRLIGGEMPGFAEDRPPAGGALLGHLAGRLPAGVRVLVAGPHEPGLVDELAARATLTCLVRSEPAAIELDARGLDVLCGTLAKLPEPGRWDVVVALDGLGRLCSAEGPQLDWAESLRALTRALRPGGTLLLAVENELGVHRLVDPATGTSAQTDDAWRPVGEFDDTRPGTPARLAARLAAEGLAVDWLAAAWPEPGRPALLATPNALRDGPVDALAALTARAAGAAYANRSVLSDPRRLAAAAVRGGLGPELAAAWLVVAHLAPRPSAVLTVPPVLLGDGPIVEISPGPDGTWRRRGPAGDSPLPPGRLVEELLLGACLRHDLPAVRRLLTGWIAALPEATADNVVVHGDTFTKLDPDVPAAADVLRQFARTLCAGGYAHPWPAATDPQALTAILHGAAGLTGDVPAVPAGDDPPQPDSRREHQEQLRALNRRLADAASRAQWYERELANREKELRKARVQIAAFSGSFGYRLARLGYAVARRARNRLQKGTR